MVGINGPRWMLRASLLGQPAVNPDGVSRLGGQHPQGRGAPRRHAMPVGEALPVVMPPQARRVDQPADEGPMTKSKLRRNISRWANPSDQETHHLRKEYARSGKSGTMSIADAPDRERVKLRGSLRTVTLRPRAGVPALEAELNDGSGVITVVWLGPAPDRRHRARAARSRSRAGSAPTRASGSCTTPATS